MEQRDYSHEVRPLTSRSARWLLVAAGTVLVGIGILGVILPLLPGTPFLLLAAACYARASTRFYNWLLNNRLVGPTLAAWREDRSIPFRAKVSAISMVIIAFGISAGFVIEPVAARMAMAVLGLGIVVFLMRLPTSEAA